EIATDAEKAPAYMAGVVLSFNEQMERILEVVLVILVGGMFSLHFLQLNALWFIPLLLLVIRPVAVMSGLTGSTILRTEKGMISWLGIRGIGSLYYLMYAIQHGLPEEYAHVIIAMTLSAVVTSIIIHGITVSPLMKRYEDLLQRVGAK
ncbi:MAG TPA: cation:proton antiporter, partial [Patescibacteria group bacterium]|nr:cation:proton antiporter [Patescibacteria group bacterium]